MRRQVMLIAVLLFAGAVLNVAVAWGYVAWAWKPGQMDKLFDASARVSGNQILRVSREDTVVGTFVLVVREVAESIADAPIEYFHGDPMSLTPYWMSLAQSKELSAAVKNAPQGIFMESRFVQGAGWPCRGCWCQLNRGASDGKNVIVQEEIMGGIPLSPPMTMERMYKVLPYIPIWPGFAINTIFYAAILWVIFFAPGKVRRAIRIRRGLCPACAYPVGTSSICTECGKPVTPPR